MSWFDAYRAYDDATLTTLANTGLLRRAAKDVEAGKLEWAEQGADDGVIAADGQRVHLDARGPQQARCDCPAPGICKHILAAVLWLRDLTPEAAPANSAFAEVLALSPAALFKAAGAAAVRRAAATPLETLIWHDEGAVLVLELPELGALCRWIAGGGFAGMISEVPASERRAVHLMALAALRREQGCPLAWPVDAQPTPAADALGEREKLFLTQVDSMLNELLAGGLAHVSEVSSARLFALNMSARGEGLPRLAALLRNLGGIVELLVRRDHRAQEPDALALMARIHALCAALPQARGELARALCGRLRRDFDATRPLDLLPLGAHWWQTRGGARGLSVAFWDSDAGQVLQAVLARPDASDTSFTRQNTWSTQALWPGAGTPRQICEAALRLEQPRMADDGRLALGGVTRALMAPAWAASDPRIATLGFDDWAVLADQLRAATGLAGNAFDMALLRPQASLPPQLDEVAQRFDWQVEDTQGRWLSLSIACGPEHRRRIDNLDRLVARGAEVRAVLVRIERDAAATLLVPVAVLTLAVREQTLQAVSLDFAEEPLRSTSLANRILRLFEARNKQAPAVAAPALGERLLAPVIDVIETQAATGRMPFTSAQAAQLRESLGHIASVGLDGLAGPLRAYIEHPTPTSLLRLAWITQVLVEMEGLPLAE